MSGSIAPRGAVRLVARCRCSRTPRPIDSTFVFDNQGESVALARRFLADEGLSLRHVVIDSESRVARSLDLRGWPTTIDLDASGKVVAVDVGLLSAAKLAHASSR